jgi:pimeloyl-ACP methyl ester carboxylesterase
MVSLTKGQDRVVARGRGLPFVSAESWPRVADALPRGGLCLVDGAGQMPWFEDPTRVAEEVGRFLAE